MHIYAFPWGRYYNIYEDNVYRHYSSLKNWKGHTWSYTYSNIWIFAYIWSNTFGQVWPVSVSPGTGVVTSPNSKIFFTVMFFFKIHASNQGWFLCWKVGLTCRLMMILMTMMCLNLYKVGGMPKKHGITGRSSHHAELVFLYIWIDFDHRWVLKKYKNMTFALNWKTTPYHFRIFLKALRDYVSPPEYGEPEICEVLRGETSVTNA